MTATPQRPVSVRDRVRPPLITIYGLQCALLLMASGITYFVNGVAAYSLLIGGLISVLPNAYFARQAFRYAGAAYAREVTRAFYRGEAGKFMATIGLFAGTFAAIKPLNVPVLFLAYVLVMLLNAALLAGFAQRRGKSRV